MHLLRIHVFLGFSLLRVEEVQLAQSGGWEGGNLRRLVFVLLSRIVIGLNV